MNSTILLVEDSTDDRLLMERAFRKAQIPAVLKCVHDGKEAVSFLSAIEKKASQVPFVLPSLIISDLKMPRMDGFELLGWTKSKPTLKLLPFIILTASNSRSDVNRAYDLGANSYLMKPAHFAQLIEITNYLSEYWLKLNQPPFPSVAAI